MWCFLYTDCKRCSSTFRFCHAILKITFFFPKIVITLSKETILKLINFSKNYLICIRKNYRSIRYQREHLYRVKFVIYQNLSQTLEDESNQKFYSGAALANKICQQIATVTCKEEILCNRISRVVELYRYYRIESQVHARCADTHNCLGQIHDRL